MDIKAYMKETFTLLDEVNSLLLKEFESIFHYDITTKQSIVLHHVNQAGTITVNELAQLMNISASAVSQLLNKLESEQYIKREINPNNRREILISLGSKGKELYEESEKIDQKIMEKYYSKLTKEEMIQFQTIVGKLHSIITNSNNE
ncbi:MarR family winged helix-turn-helix transcriptional regulator [Bacillus timonensis]|uniref:MarR family winged helix-turn-helix transcriptional regulator n=1 Tax=Bacillus timonensis TaxID=1033734 RepID=UPI00028837C0|nr:MarR family transcriptional regulator [Bacillus timonensis]